VKFRRSRDEAEIPTASMADIAFLLIVFFMLTTVFAETRGINFAVPPPDPDQDAATERDEAVHIRIAPDGTITVDNEPVDRRRVDSELAAYLLPKLRNWPEKPILVTADKSSPYGAFVEVYDALRITEKEAKEEGVVPPANSLKVSIPSLKEIEELKARFGADIFG
jgi:biopolymer transport protein ExbD